MRRTGLAAIVAVCLAYASVAQGGGENQLAHFALVRALSHGTAVVDPYHRESKDLSWFHGHYYSTKAPGLAFLTVGPYVVLDRSGLLGLASRLTGASRNAVALWALGVIGAVLPTALILLLLRLFGETVEPGFGAVAAVTAGLCTLLFPFATLFFDHALSAALGLTAFVLLWRGRKRPATAAAAGLVAGLGITSEYPLVLVAGALGLYVLAASGDRVRCAAAYAVGVVVGVMPLVVYDWWAFGSPFHLSYEHAILVPGASGHDVLGANDTGLYGVSTPQQGVVVQLLFGELGLVTRTPVVVAAAAGLVLLWRRGFRHEALLAGALGVAYVIYNAAYATPFGGGTPGPRFLIPMLPFLALGLASVWRRVPWATLALAIPSGLLMLGVTAVDPIYASTWAWRHRLTSGSLAGAGVGPRLPLALFVLAAVVLCALATPFRRPSPREGVGAVLALAAYGVVAVVGPREAGTNPRLLLVLVALCTLVVVLWHTGAGRFSGPRPQPTRDPS